MKGVILLLMVIGCAERNDGAYNCQGYGSPSVPQETPPMPVLPNVFQTRIEATIAEDSYTVSVEEYVDYPNNRATLNIMKSGQQFKLLFDYAHHQLLYILPGGLCNVTDINTDESKLLLDSVKLPDAGGLHVFPSSSILQLMNSNNVTYMGQIQVRGVMCDWWQSQVTWKQMYSVFTLNFYFSVSSWETPAGYTAQGGNLVVPVRSEICCVVNTTNTFHHIYDYSSFNVNIPPHSSVFETPAGVTCPGRSQPRRLPKFKNTFKYRAETYTYFGDFTLESTKDEDVWYNKNFRLVRYDFTPNSPKDHETSRIDDFNTDVTYTIDKLMMNCTISRIVYDEYGALVNRNNSLGIKKNVVEIMNPEHVFHLDSNYTYAGQRIARGRLCDVFISKRHNEQLSIPATYEYYFLAEDNDDYGNHATLIKLIITAPSAMPFTSISNYYKFVQEEPLVTDFDVSSCFELGQKILFKVTFNGKINKQVKEYKRVFILETIAALANSAGVSPLRISNTDLYFEQDHAVFFAALLDKAPVFPSTGKNELHQESLQGAWQNIETSINNRHVKVTIDFGTYTLSFTATDIVNLMDDSNNNTQYSFPTSTPAPASLGPGRSDIACEADSITSFVPVDQLPVGTQLTWRDPACGLTSNGTHLLSTIGHNQCGTTVKITQNSVEFENELIAQSTKSTQSLVDFGDSSFVIPVKCIYPRQTQVATFYQPTQQHVRFYEKRYGHFDVDIVQYKTDKFVTPVQDLGIPRKVPIKSQIYVEAGINDQYSSGLGIHVDQCIATRTPSPSDSVYYSLIKDGCPIIPHVTLYNSTNSKVRFGVEAFRFVTANASDVVYIHCQVSVCDAATPHCAVNCMTSAGRRRRAAAGSGDKTHLLSTGPFMLVVDDQATSLSSSNLVAAISALVAVIACIVAIIGWTRRRHEAVTQPNKL